MKTPAEKAAGRDMKKARNGGITLQTRKYQTERPVNNFQPISPLRSSLNVILPLMIWIGTLSLSAQNDVNYREELVPVYALPDPLTFEQGEKVRNTSDWEQRRQELISHFEEEMFGITPPWKGSVKGTILSEKMACNHLWADPRGEFLSCVFASPVYALYGVKGPADVSMAAVNTPVRGEAMAYHIREGEHNITAAEWEHYLDFAEKVLRKND